MLDPANNKFRGPLFIVGNGSSGTDLLLDLLNCHPDISLPPNESEILPYWVRHWPSYGNLRNSEAFGKFYRSYLASRRWRGPESLYPPIHEDRWLALCPNITPASAFEAIRRHDAGITHESPRIWGDKSPGYVNHLPLLKSLFPSAKFVHIVRDVRDVSLSMNRRWGKNVVRAAYRWNENVLNIRRDSMPFLQDYLEVKYESLISDPRKELALVHHFVGVHENLEWQRNIRIDGNNTKKYLNTLSQRTIRKIEEVSSAGLITYGYQVDNPVPTRQINRILRLYYKLLDGLNLIRCRSEHMGFLRAFKHSFWLYNTHSNRLRSLRISNSAIDLSQPQERRRE
ncbi:MAG: sulfotransferase [Nitrosomonadales bacterium]|nr:sulfotransferase [Nitrosomonadales bacterium]